MGLTLVLALEATQHHLCHILFVISTSRRPAHIPRDRNRAHLQSATIPTSKLNSQVAFYLLSERRHKTYMCLFMGPRTLSCGPSIYSADSSPRESHGRNLFGAQVEKARACVVEERCSEMASAATFGFYPLIEVHSESQTSLYMKPEIPRA